MCGHGGGEVAVLRFEQSLNPREELAVSKNQPSLLWGGVQRVTERLGAFRGLEKREGCCGIMLLPHIEEVLRCAGALRSIANAAGPDQGVGRFAASGDAPGESFAGLVLPGGST